ncbi:MAG: hypothetical protein A3B70_00080 [Deltaproteobacteria bacterium RIFCSPHIGHO2_02_FULL_40_11]|nr:MAG: hypothetical protein A3B70_00080 [Deltaproteobacteria bacterium RIFCSPHIGHO2_02_FULL_40_11]
MSQLHTTETSRRKRERIIIVFLAFLMAVLVFCEFQLVGFSKKLPFISSVFFFVLINVNIILIGLLIFLVFRNVVKLIWEKQNKILGYKLKTKLVIIFLSFTLIPAVLLFTVSAFYINNSFGKWFNVQLTHSLQNALDVNNNYYQSLREKNFHFGDLISDELSRNRLYLRSQKKALSKTIQSFQKKFVLDGIEIFSNLEGMGIASVHPDFRQQPFPPLEQQFLKEGFLGRQASLVQHLKEGDLIRSVLPLYDASRRKIIAAMVISSYVPSHIVEKVGTIEKTFHEYREIKPIKRSLKTIYFTILLLMTLLIIFTAVWLGFHLARELTTPIQKLVEGTQEVSQGNLNVQIESQGKDELSMLIHSFNHMTKDLRESSQKLAHAYAELQRTNTELSESSRYMEAILKNIKAGVISVDSNGLVTMINAAAESLLDIKAYKYMGASYQSILPQKYLILLEEALRRSPEVSEHTVDRHVKMNIRGQEMTLIISITTMRDEDGKYMGMVIVLDDLTELIKVQRVAAWREVARRIAHEIKNPLTPIKLSAQRLRRKYLPTMADETFDESTKMIITQVDELKDLVNEFSNFAKLPEAVPRPCRLQVIIKEAISLYQEAHQNIQFEFEMTNKIPVLALDRDQIKRVFINLIDNAVAAIEQKGSIRIVLSYRKAFDRVVIEVQDTGCGIPKEMKPHLFEPNFSTKKTGTGLGLAIVRKIISDHQGFVRVMDHSPQGSKFVIELPVYPKEELWMHAKINEELKDDKWSYPDRG